MLDSFGELTIQGECLLREQEIFEAQHYQGYQFNNRWKWIRVWFHLFEIHFKL